MRVFKNVFSKSYEAAADLSTGRYRFVKPSTGVAGGPQMRVARCGAGELMVGIQQDAPNAIGLATNVQHHGTSKLVVDGSGTAIVVGDLLKSDANGKGVKATTGDIAGAVACEASAADGDIIEVWQVLLTAP